jgi:hypothetical protein
MKEGSNLPVIMVTAQESNKRLGDPKAHWAFTFLPVIRAKLKNTLVANGIIPEDKSKLAIDEFLLLMMALDTIIAGSEDIGLVRKVVDDPNPLVDSIRAAATTLGVKHRRGISTTIHHPQKPLNGKMTIRQNVKRFHHTPRLAAHELDDARVNVAIRGNNDVNI